jgi:hypothetical protein
MLPPLRDKVSSGYQSFGEMHCLHFCNRIRSKNKQEKQICHPEEGEAGSSEITGCRNAVYHDNAGSSETTNTCCPNLKISTLYFPVKPKVA